MGRGRRRLVTTAALLSCAFATADAAAAATRATPAGASFAVDALTASPREAFYHFSAQPGSTVDAQIRIVNTSAGEGTARLYAVDATTGQTSGAVYRSEREPRADVGAWTLLGSGTVRLAAGESRVLPFRVRVPLGVRPGEHLGGIVVEDAAGVAPTAVKRRGASFAIRVRTLLVTAVQVDVPGPRFERLDMTGLKTGGNASYPTLLLGIRNAGNVMSRPTGRLSLRDARGRPIVDAVLRLDTLVPGSSIDYPVPAPRLRPGRYTGVGVLRFHGRVERRTFGLNVSAAGDAQVYGSRAAAAPAAGGSSDGGSADPLVLVAAGSGLLLLGFGAAVLVLRRPVRRAET